ncbi:hypothetical protein AMJ52_08815 [candidate division TA06 bacterium DG_78]|uniref:PepSY domain-containing protein n=1 Tax=candidate division TA06 bacterium DG_78 TaxID=1703772 RepID=A0A0S7YAU3_UNCT6|nr:MAG: hypothetical protein AMJ52_08815 [candidate division TA06 bacterium DG_78]
MYKYIIISLILLISWTVAPADTGDNSEHSLGWALDIANEVRDAKMPGAKLEEILGSVDENGVITTSEETNEWTFNYYLQRGENYDGLGVTVYYNGSTFSWDHGSLYNVEILSYEDAKPWVQKADGEVGNIKFAYRSVQVMADYDDIYADVDITVYVYYNTPDGDLVAYVILDADTKDIIFVELAP